MILPNGGSLIFGIVKEEEIRKGNWKYIKVKWCQGEAVDRIEDYSWVRYDRVKELDFTIFDELVEQMSFKYY